MSLKRIFFNLTIFSLLICLLISPALFWLTGQSANAQDASDGQDVEVDQNPIVRTPQRIFLPHWTTEGDFVTTIYLHNAHIQQAITTKLSLILNNRIIALPETFIAPFQTVAIDLEEAMMANGEKIEQNGGAFIDFEAESAGTIDAYAQVLDDNRSLSFTFPFMEKPSTSDGLEAVAWYYDDHTDAFIAVQNTSEEAATVAPVMFFSGEEMRLGRKHLKPQEATIIKLPSQGRSGKDKDQNSTGVRLDYIGNPGAVVAQGWVVNEKIGFSARFTFHLDRSPNDTGGIKHIYGAGIQIGEGTPVTGSAGVNFSPYLAVRNPSGNPIEVRPIFSYQAGDETRKTSLPSILLGPQESRLVNLRDFQDDGTNTLIGWRREH